MKDKTDLSPFSKNYKSEINWHKTNSMTKLQIKNVLTGRTYQQITIGKDGHEKRAALLKNSVMERL